jgi:dsDNA-binding SOS-regulon protein
MSILQRTFGTHATDMETLSTCVIKTHVPVWLERYVLPICVTLVVGLVILNPLKMDWQQRVSLFLAISAFAYFIGHSLHRTASQIPIDDASKINALEQRIATVSKQSNDVLQSRQEEVDALKKQLTNYETQLQEKKKREEIREHLAVFLNEGETLRARCLKQASVPAPQKEADDWANAGESVAACKP